MQHAEALRVLGVEASAPWPEVRAAYRRLIRTSHPDVAGPESTARAARLNQAYAVLLRLRRTDRAAQPPRPATPPPPPPPRPSAAPGRATLVGDDTMVLGCPPREAFARVLEAGHTIGEVTYVDRSVPIVEVVIDADGEAASLVMTFTALVSPRGVATEILCTLEALSRVASLDPGPMVRLLMAALSAP